jgi:hypothetical protein
VVLLLSVLDGEAVTELLGQRGDVVAGDRRTGAPFRSIEVKGGDDGAGAHVHCCVIYGNFAAR